MDRAHGSSQVCVCVRVWLRDELESDTHVNRLVEHFAEMSVLGELSCSRSIPDSESRKGRDETPAVCLALEVGLSETINALSDFAGQSKPEFLI
jgi:hypothetical protein